MNKNESDSWSADGAPHMTFGTHGDITRQKQAEEELARIFSMSLDMICIANLKTATFIKVNPAFTEILGHSEEALLDRPFLDFIHPDDIDATRMVIEQKLQAGAKVINFENRYRCKDGSYRWLSWASHPNPEQDVIYAVARDITKQKHNEEKLRVSEARYRRITENSPDMIYRMSLPDGKYEYVSPAAETIYGYPPKMWYENPLLIREIIHPDWHSYFKVQWEQLLKGLVPPTYEYQIVRKNGEVRWINQRNVAVRDSEDNLIAIEGIVTDITDRKKAEEALISKDAMLADLASQVPGMLYQFMMAPDGGFSVPYSSKGVMDIFGCSPEDVRDDFEPIFNAIHSEDRNKILQTIDASVKNLSQWKCEYRVQVPGGPVKWIYGNSIPEKRADGSIVWSGYNMDITESKQAETALRESEEQFRHFFEHLTIGVAVYEAVDDGEDFLIADLNPAGQKLSSVSIDEIQGKRLTQVFPGVKDLGLFKALQNVRRTGTPEYVPLRLYQDERIHEWVENRVFKLPSGKVVAVYDDRTELVRLEEGLRQAQKMEAIGTLAGGIAHDFNNMLSIITGNISYAISILNKDDALFEVLSDVLEGTKRAKNLTHQLLTFAKGGEPIKKLCNINKLLKESAEFVTSGAKSICNFNLADDLWTAEVDSGQLNQVVGNIVINANQAMPGGGIITIRTENTEIGANSGFPLSAGKYIKIAIEDQGIGIQEKHVPYIFDPYFTTKQSGSGLGLATAFSIIRRHTGHITVHSEIGKGTIFDIYLPASSKEHIEAKEDEQPKHPGGGRILIMDDQKPILRMVERMLNGMGYEAETVTDGAEAIELYHKSLEAGRPFDLVILDLTVPGGMGGQRTIQELLKIDSTVKAVVSSGYSNDPIMAFYQDYGFCGIMPKPYTKKHLAELLNKIEVGKQRV